MPEPRILCEPGKEPILCFPDGSQRRLTASRYGGLRRTAADQCKAGLVKVTAVDVARHRRLRAKEAIAALSAPDAAALPEKDRRRHEQALEAFEREGRVKAFCIAEGAQYDPRTMQAMPIDYDIGEEARERYGHEEILLVVR